MECEKLLQAVIDHGGGEVRVGQSEMVQAIDTTFTRGARILVEAGTGTGKSLGYLVPAISRILRSQATVVVSTATLALQNQLIKHDIPQVLAALPTSDQIQVRTQVVKGWNNYLCLRKFHDDGDGPQEEKLEVDFSTASSSKLGREAIKLRDWAQKTGDGDRDNVDFPVSNVIWSGFSTSSLECLGETCVYVSDCFAQQARLESKSANLIVTNHTILGLYAAGNTNLLPDFDYLILDEGHEITNRVTAALSQEFELSEINHLARQLQTLGVAAGDLSEIKSMAEELMDSLSPGVINCNDSQYFTVLVPAIQKLTTRLNRLHDQFSTLANKPDKASVKSLLSDLIQKLQALCLVGDGQVLWVRGEGQFPKLVLSPLEIGGILNNSLWQEKSVAITSATLRVNGSFEAVGRSFGVSNLAEFATDFVSGEVRAWSSLKVDSPFDYAKQGILYVPTYEGNKIDIAEQLAQMEQLILASGGRTLGLFTSLSAAKIAAEALRELVPFEIFCQGEQSVGSLIQEFQVAETSCLFGTLSLWQGVNVPGEACRLVIIDKLPFPRPDDPIKSARSNFVKSRGGNGFMQVYATEAAILLAQGAGRLIRTVSDRGVVAILDKRIHESRYSSYMKKSLPSFWQTRDLQVVLHAISRLNE